jgi:pimeloyl-ACP methyl ester carboxylesterase
VQELNPPREQTAASAAGSGMTKDDVAALRVPALFIVGSEDPLIPPQIIRQVHELVPDSEYVEFEGCGHSVYWESPGEFNETVAAFLAKHSLEDRP